MTSTLQARAISLFRMAPFAIAAMIILILAYTITAPPAHAHKNRHAHTLSGTVKGNESTQSGYKVSLYVTYVSGQKKSRVLGTATTDGGGKFKIHYRRQPLFSHGLHPILFILAEDGPVMLASAIGTGFRVHNNIVVNERTTVATGIAFAQFIDGRKIRGNTYGMLNAVKMTENMANTKTGDVGEVLFKTPNGTETRTYSTFNSLTNVVASCVADDTNCNALFAATTPAGGPVPTTVLQAVANIAKYPSYPGYPTDTDDPLFQLSLLDPINQPALTKRPTNWLLFIKFTGGSYSLQDRFNLMNGPGNVAIDERGFAWINDNYVPKATPEIACAGLRLMKFYPWGKPFPGSPYFGGGLSGAGFGITLDPRGNVWVGNFGFESPECAEGGTIPANPSKKIPATHNSVSVFRPNGVPLSSSDGFTKGNMWWPQATVSDPKGNIWLANCGNDSVTVIHQGKPWRVHNILFPGAGTPTAPNLKPFGIAIDPKGRAWVTGNKANAVYIVSRDGNVDPVDSSPVVLSHPMGISGDSKGNMWVSSSDAVKIPCVDPFDPQNGGNPSIVLYPANGDEPRQFKGGGLSIPWGNAVDGNDTLWVFNFGQAPMKDVEVGFEWPETGISHFCGTGPCPARTRKNVGDPISPVTGYTSDALDRITGGNIDPSGNLWLMNNWKKDGPVPVVYNANPGGNSFVIVPGAATPVKTPLIGPPQSFGKGPHNF